MRRAVAGMWWLNRWTCAGVVAVSFASIAAPTLGAQLDKSVLSECTANLPPSVFTRVTIHLAADPIDSVSRSVVSTVDLLTQSVASRIRQMLGATGPVIPAGDSALRWNELGAVVIVVHANGRYTWRERDTTAGSLRPVRAGDMLLRRGLAATREAEGIVFVPEGALRDSARFGRSFWEPIVSPTAEIQQAPMRVGFPIFTLPIPWTKPLESIRPPQVKYPAAPRNATAEGRLMMQFTVDTTGRVVMSSVRDVWPAGRPRYTGALGVYYDDFVKAVTKALEDARYTPTEIGGCRVSHMVMQPFLFKMRP